MTTLARRNPVLVVGIVAGVGLASAGWIAGNPVWAVCLAALFPIGYAIVVSILSTRIDGGDVLAGRPIDERAVSMNLEAGSWALGITAVVVLAAFAAAQASRGDSAPYAVMATVIAVAYVGSLLIVRRSR
jgi:hypothetical protein